MKKKSKPKVTVSQKITELNTLKRRKKQVKSSFFQDLKEEMQKVSWTTKQELRICGNIVLISMLSFGLGIYAIDLFLRFTLDGLKGVIRLMGV